MMAADQLFFKGRFLPFKDTPCGGSHHHHHHHHHHHQCGCAGAPTAGSRVTTLRDELRAHDDGERPGKGGSARWKELLGLRKKNAGGGGGGTSGAEAAADSPQFHRS